MSNLTGQSLGRYQILELLGQGGMAMVYKANDPRLEREVAIKIIRLETFPPEDLQDVRKRFEREAKALARLSHPNIIKVMDYGEYEGSPFLVMEYLQGGTLKQVIGESLSWQEAVRLLIPVARGLEYAHQRGIVHRDIKPANVLLTENGEPTLSDFGIVKLFQGQETTTLTASGAAIGTPEYMAPEQWTGETDPKSDMYSLGVVLYEMVTGQRPYDADTPGGLFLKQVTEPLPLPRDIAPDLPESVERLLLKVLAKEPSERYDDFGVLVKELESLLTEHSLQARSEKLEPSKFVKVQKADADRKAPPPPRPSRRWVGAIIVTIVLVGLVLGGVFGLPPLLSGPENTPESTMILTEKAGQEPTQPVTSKAELSPTSEATSTPEATTTPELGIGSTMISDQDSMVMVYVPAGEFIKGSDNNQVLDEMPAHKVYLDAFWIDQTEVTNEMYSLCVNAHACNEPTTKNSAKNVSYYGNTAFNNYPVIYVDWNMAVSYCTWAGRRLPSEAEWEKVARGNDGSTYPWGNDPPNSNLLNYNNMVGDTSPVKSYEKGKSVFGAYDMAGNVWEWVNDWYSDTYYSISPPSNPPGPISGQERVHRGGSYVGGDSYIYSAKRDKGRSDFIALNLGFRCALSASE